MTTLEVWLRCLEIASNYVYVDPYLKVNHTIEAAKLLYEATTGVPYSPPEIKNTDILV